MRGMTWVNVSANRRGFIGVLVAVLVAATLVTGLGVLIESGVRGGVSPQRYAAVDVVVGAPQRLSVPEDVDPALTERRGVPTGVVQQLAQLGGVVAAVGDSAVPIAIDGHAADAHGWSSASTTGYRLTGGRAATRHGEIVVSEGISAGIGQLVRVDHGGQPMTFTVVGRVIGPVIGSARTPVLFISDTQAKELAPHPGMVDTVLLTARPGVSPDSLAAVVKHFHPELQAYTGRARGDAEFLDSGKARGDLIGLGTAFAGTAVMIALFVIASTLSLSIQQRRREFALLRAVGATPRQIHRMVGREVLLVAGAGVLLGVAPGYLLARVLQSWFVEAGVLPDDFVLKYSPIPAVGAVVLGALTARLAAWVSVRGPAKADPIAALSEAATSPARVSRTRVVIGALLGASGIGLSLLPVFVSGPGATAGAASAALVLMISVGLLGPLLVRAGIGLLGRPMLRSGKPALFLAAVNTRGNARRLAAAVVPLALAISIGCVQLFAQSTTEAEANHQSAQGITADVVVADNGSGLSPAAVAAIAHTPGVVATNPIARSSAYVIRTKDGKDAPEQFALQGIDPAATDSTLDLKVRSGSLDALRGDGEIAMSRDAASAAGVGVGDSVRLSMGDGVMLQPKVVALYDRGLGFGDLTMRNDIVREHTTSTMNQSILVRTAEGQQAAVTAALAKEGYTAVDRSTLQAAGKNERSAAAWASLIALGVLMAYLAVAVINTLVMATGERRREFALLRLVGSSARQVRSMMRVESAIIVITAGVLGTLAAIPPLVGVSISISGQPLPTITPAAYAVILGVTAVLGAVALGWATRSVLRTDPVDAIGSRE